jgi:ATP-dependent helicase/nuclease subunit B
MEEWIIEARRQRRWEGAEMHRLAWSALCELLENIHATLADTTVTAAELAGMLRATFADLTLGLAPPTLDQVLVSSIERSRHPDIQHAWVLAFNEGVFPARPAEDLLLTTAERETLVRAGLTAPAPHRDEAFGERLLAYIAFTRPSQSLTISYATVAEDGGTLLPSPLLAELHRALPGLQATRASPHEPPSTVAELAREYLGVRSDLRRVRERQRYERLCECLRANPARAGPLEWLLRGTRPRRKAEQVGHYRQAAAIDEPAWDGSPSEVEAYLRCPFKHFATYGLCLEAARGPRPLRWDLGAIAHKLLARLTQRAMREPGGVRAVPDERWQALLQTTIQVYDREQLVDQAERRPDLSFMTTVLARSLQDVVAAHAARWRRGLFEPLYCEKWFRAERVADALSGVILQLADGRPIHLHGQIDRVDVCHDGAQQFLLVYDYKSGRVEAPRREFLIGQQLQLFLYLLALRQALGPGAAMQPAGVLVAPLYPDWAALTRDYVAQAAPAEQTMYLYRPRGWIEEHAARLLDTQLGSRPSPVALLQLRKDHAFHANSDVATSEELEARLDLAAQTVRWAAAGICAGHVDVRPLVENHALACRNCEFRPVCRFDPLYDMPRVAERSLPQLAPSRSAGDDA